MSRAAVFLDRDGVINRNRDDYVRSAEELELLPGALEAIRRLAAAGWPVVVVTNQSAVGRGLVSAERVEEIHARLLEAVRGHGGAIDAVYFCPHTPGDGCNCRKPGPGLLLTAARELGLDLGRSFFVGDALSDVQAARAAGCRPILVRTGRGRREIAAAGELPADLPVADDLAAAVARILDGGGERRP